MRNAGVPVVAHGERFAPHTPDSEWLTVAGQEHWIVLTRDKNIRRKPDEIEALRQGNVIAFVLASGNATAADTAELVTRVLRRLHRTAVGAKRPALFTVSSTGMIRSLPIRTLRKSSR